MAVYVPYLKSLETYMIDRKPTLFRNLQTGYVLTKRLISSGETGLFKKRPYGYKQAFIDILFFLIPYWLMTVVVCIFAFFSGNYDGILRGIIGGVGISLLMVWVTRGAFGYELGGCGSETD